jgi:adenylate cyclase
MSFRLRRYSLRVLALLLGLLFAALALTYRVVSRFNDANAREHAAANLDLAARVFEEATRQRIESLVQGAGLMTKDDGIRTNLRVADADTLSSYLQSFTQRVNSPVIALFDPNRKLLANSDPTMANENEEPFRHLIGLALRDDLEHASYFSYLNDQLHVLVVVPAYSPRPNVVAWFGLAFPIDQAVAEKIKAISRVEVTFVSTEDRTQPKVLASTLPPAAAEIVARAATEGSPLAEARLVDLPDGPYVSLFRPRPMLGEDPINIILQRPLNAELASAVELKNYLLLTSLLALVGATLLALWIARDVSRPVLTLAAHTKHIAAGDYARRIDLQREDELGQLATAFNDMSAGLAERDRVRDLLDKNVSPEVAAQLMRDGAALGGEEREVTILFADLRGFTTMSEKFAPRELLTLLNRYLDRMSGEIERNGGVIDKFIGDAIMALFGAPVAQGDAADRALAAALAMERALADLNRELAAEGRPPLGIGVGINTARVIAGNIGSHRRLNYSVIGDGVNVASRLQSETRKVEHGTNLITSAATVAACRTRPNVRPLGLVHVKGRHEPVEIFAVE